MDGQLLDQRIGQRIRGRREELGLSLEDLSTRCGVSRSMISKIERVESSPTAALLGKLCAGLGLTLSGLMADAERAPQSLLRRADQVTWRDPESGYVRRIVSPPQTGSSIEIVEIELPPGARVVFEAWKMQAYQQDVLVLDGTLTMTTGDETFEMKPGDCVHRSVESKNVYENRTKKDTRYLVVVDRGR
jgi:transcriptional regulator with XRE-family HTH domain